MPRWVTSPLHKAIIEALVMARRQAGLTQRDLASLMERPPSFVGKVESVERNLSVHEFVAWCEALRVDPANVISDVRRSQTG